MKERRLTFEELEALCKRERCHFNDLFLVGGAVFVMEDVEDWRLPNKYRPLLLDEPEKLRKLPEFLRRLDATEFPSMQALRNAIADRAEYVRVFPKLRDELYEILTKHNRSGAAPDGGQYYLNLDGCAEEEGLIVACETKADLSVSLIADMQRLLQAFDSTLKWNIRVYEGNNQSPFRIIRRDCVESLS